jgi:starvation-inducible DNA-binding protein
VVFRADCALSYLGIRGVIRRWPLVLAVVLQEARRSNILNPMETAMARATAKNLTELEGVARLETPTDLQKKGVKAVAEAVNGLLADAFVLYLKTKTFHWHVSGPNFRDYHILLDEQAAQIYASIDPLAERVRKLGERTLLGIDHIVQLASIKDNSKDYVPAGDMIEILLEDNRSVAEAMRKAHKICDDNNDVATASLLEIYIDETERRIWFLFETSRSAGPAGH